MKIPKKINFAHLPTPIEKIRFHSKEFLIKRDDYTGSDFLGNKIRKLEYLLYEAKKEKADIIFTCGGDQSNHARATLSAAAKLGIKTRLYLWGKEKNHADGNLFLDKMYGAEIVYLNKKEFLNVDKIMTEERAKLVKKGKRVYVILAGGSSTLGIWGYISFIEELKKQINITKIDGIFSACGSGGTAAGLLVGASVNRLNLKIYAVNVLFTKDDMKKKILQLAEGAVLDYKMPCKINESNLEIFDGYSTEGYKNISDNKIKIVTDFARETGILLDPAYTGKAFCAYNDLVLSKGKGERIIFLHTGGIFGTFPKRKEFLKIS
ncbi:MAG: pyridoxal-phosphate dependent enzyme [Ignavibacteriaceae bacterium]|nr:pyridoxal-phosphate dependent enzyme [Ignavibacteriaceae bacterium]MCW8823601.1 pyridoxal-phosphate dependent enzyme [Ignavibacteriaceae bacterium]MCW8961832.1 pyridoxal-phosphate dependent enzyme [Ignavibacteriaceae bacterium]